MATRPVLVRSSELVSLPAPVHPPLARPAARPPTHPAYNRMHKTRPMRAHALAAGIIGMIFSYIIPIFLRLTLARKWFKKGPVHMGRFSLLLGWAAIIWGLFISVSERPHRPPAPPHARTHGRPAAASPAPAFLCASSLAWPLRLRSCGSPAVPQPCAALRCAALLLACRAFNCLGADASCPPARPLVAMQVILCLPTVYPINKDNLNYAPIAVVSGHFTLLASVGWGR